MNYSSSKMRSLSQGKYISKEWNQHLTATIFRDKRSKSLKMFSLRSNKVFYVLNDQIEYILNNFSFFI